jgi:hypothetical protein
MEEAGAVPAVQYHIGVGTVLANSVERHPQGQSVI